MRAIKSETDFHAAMAKLDHLMALDPEPATSDGEELEALSVLIEAHENERFHFDLPDPIDAIVFRMKEQGLKQKDLQAYLGSKSRVSEVLSRKRPLTLQMIRSLHEGLGIPAEVLIKSNQSKPICPGGPISIHVKPQAVREMIQRGWIETREALDAFFATPGELNLNTVSLRSSVHVCANKQMDEGALLAWITRLGVVAKNMPPQGEFSRKLVTRDFLSSIARLSYLEKGPSLAQEALSKNGIAMIVVRHLSGTHLDGCALMTNKGWPVIGLTLRHDRLDNFWFTLLHELAHIASGHTDQRIFIDDTIAAGEKDDLEKEADNLASEAIMPKSKWGKSDVRLKPSKSKILDLSRKLQVSPAIIAGRIRHETGNYRYFSEMIGNGQVRMHFSEDFNDVS